MPRTGADLALLLLGAYRRLVDDAVVELARRGFPDARPHHDFALRAIAEGADNASSLGRSLAVTKQAAAKTIAALTERGYVVAEDDPRDARRKRLRLTEHARDYLHTGGAVFDGLRGQLAADLGVDALEALETQLQQIVGDRPVRLESPGWVSQGG